MGNVGQHKQELEESEAQAVWDNFATGGSLFVTYNNQILWLVRQGSGILWMKEALGASYSEKWEPETLVLHLEINSVLKNGKCSMILLERVLGRVTGAHLLTEVPHKHITKGSSTCHTRTPSRSRSSPKP
jgi:hypothetical protein